MKENKYAYVTYRSTVAIPKILSNAPVNTECTMFLPNHYQPRCGNTLARSGAVWQPSTCTSHPEGAE